MRRILFLAGLLMAVTTSIVFGRGANGIISHPGFALEHTGYDARDWLDENLYYEPHSGAVMLRPNLELDSMVTGEYDTTALPASGDWAEVVLPGQPALTLLHQSDTTATGWQVSAVGSSGAAYGRNRGFVVYWSKYATPTGSDPKIEIFRGSSILAADDESITANLFLDINPGKNILIRWWNNISDATPTLERVIEFPANYAPNENGLNVLAVFPVDKYLIFGFGGVENTVAVEIPEPEMTTDANGASYPVLLGKGGFYVTGDGAAIVGFRGITYGKWEAGEDSTGWLESPWFDPGCIPSDTATFKITSSIQPTGTLIHGGYPGGKPGDIEGADGSGDPTGRIRYKFGLYGSAYDTTLLSSIDTPYLYRWRMKDPLARESGTATPYTLTSDVITYTESANGNRDGSFNDWTTDLTVNCYTSLYANLLTWRNASMAMSFNPGDGAVVRATHFVDAAEMVKSSATDVTLSIHAQSVVKRLRLTPILAAESFDDRGWRHGDLMSFLASLGGISLYNSVGSPLSSSDYASDPLLPKSAERDRANWQFAPGTSIWEAMTMLREYSGWLLYPNHTGGLIYKTPPTSASAADWTLDMADFANVRYSITDLARTRFLVVGQAAADDTAGRFRRGDGIMAYSTDSTLETAIGESRPLFLVDPALSTVDQVDNMAEKLKGYYTALHKTVTFTIQDFKSYKTMRLFQVLAISDAAVSDIDGKYMVTGLRISADSILMSAEVEAISL